MESICKQSAGTLGTSEFRLSHRYVEEIPSDGGKEINFLYVEIPRRKNKINQFINEQRNAKALTETGEKEI